MPIKAFAKIATPRDFNRNRFARQLLKVFRKIRYKLFCLFEPLFNNWGFTK
jgi:hypothetical protein